MLTPPLHCPLPHFGPCRHQSPSVLVPALRTVGNIVTGDDMQTQIIINCGALPCLLNLLTTSHKKSIKKEACWTISNITAGTRCVHCSEQGGVMLLRVDAQHLRAVRP